MPDYDEYYYRKCCGAPYERSPIWLEYFTRLGERIITDLQPRTALDAGCAYGMLVEVLRDRGVEAWGLDISEYALRQARADIQPYLWQGSVIDPLPQRYDLIICIEVLEHLPKAEAELAIANLCASADDIVFSSTPLDYREPTHYSVQPPEAWAQAFARQGFFREMDLDLDFMAPWAAHFRRAKGSIARQVGQYEHSLWQLKHENTELRAALVEMQNQVRIAESQATANAGWKAQVEAYIAENNRLSADNHHLRLEYEQLQSDNAQLRQSTADLSRQVGQSQARVDEIESGAGWWLLMTFRRARLALIPPTSRRERVFYRLIGKKDER
jgi:regulator of replication initiation timing